ncbi:MAG: hypothetical protein ACK51F_16415 [Rhodospirillales bacterium]
MLGDVTLEIIYRILALSVVLAGAETLHGILRMTVVAPRLGATRAVRLAAFSGTALAFAICWVMVPPLGLAGDAAHLALGVWLAMFMAGYDIALGRFLLRRPWPVVMRDFDPRGGNLLAFALAALACMPWVVCALR